MKKISPFIIIILILITWDRTISQVTKTPIHHFSFDSCNLVDSQNKATSTSVGPITCDCGVVNKALKWSGGLNFANWDAVSIQSLFTSDFTVSFYFKPDRSISGTMDILSKQSKCGIDSFFNIKYISGSHTITAGLTGKVDNQGALNTVLPDNFCWFYIAFTKQGQKISLYINGEEKAFKINNFNIQVVNKAPLSIGNSPCLASQSESRFKGVLDELKLYNTALSRDEIKSQYKEADKLLTKDTIILKGQSVNIRANASCANTFTWFPSAGVQNPLSQITRITPSTTTIYYLSSVQNECRIRDSIKITVVDAAALDCNKIQIPNAFTPNGDGLNDLFRVTNHYVITAMKSFDVFDRWGAKIYSGNTPTSGWDGNINGRLANPGLYVYHLKYNCNGVDTHKSGSFKLIR